MIDQDVRRHIETWLHTVSQDEGVRILYAAEFGSRAWGFASPDSDYDVRFLYVHPRDWYVQLSEERDVIERPLDERLVDLAAWDIRKALRLLLRSNPALYEWLVSPITYVDDGVLRTELKTMFEAHASPKTLAHHYWSIARSQWKSQIDGASQARLKKYFYVIRPLLSASFVADHARPPPMSIDALLAASRVPADVRAAIDELLLSKRCTPELGVGPRIADIDRWAEMEFQRLNPETFDLADKPRQDMRAAADRLYRRLIGVDL